jgi:hypothetical protein
MGLVRALPRWPQRQDIEPRRSQKGIPGRMGRTARMSWEQLFFDPIELHDGQVLRSLRDAGEFIQLLPKMTQDRQEWWTGNGLLGVAVALERPHWPRKSGSALGLNVRRAGA